jgi:hypothetical protein
MTTWSLKMIRKFSQTTTMTLLAATLAAGCGQSQPVETAQAVHVAALPPVAGCDSVKQVSRLGVLLRPVLGVDDLFLVEAQGGEALCIDSTSGVHAMLLRLSFVSPLALTASNPMPGNDPSGQDETSSNPMTGDPGNSNASSNPMPGQYHKQP